MKFTHESKFFFSQNLKSSLQLFRDASYGAAIVAVNVSVPRTIPRQLAVSKFHCVFLESQDIDLGMVALGVIFRLGCIFVSFRIVKLRFTLHAAVSMDRRTCFHNGWRLLQI